jgi:hypothetical protein
LFQDEAENAGDAAHRRGFLTKYWGKRPRQKTISYFFLIPRRAKIKVFLKKQKSGSLQIIPYFGGILSPNIRAWQ